MSGSNVSEYPEARGDEEEGAEAANGLSQPAEAAPNGEATDQPLELSEEELAKLDELDQAIAKFESQKRWSDVIRNTVAKADIVRDPALKVELLSRAGAMYIERSSNQAEAIKCFERVLEVDELNETAIQHLKGLYEKRRDWERLVRVMEREVDLLEPDDRPLRFLEVARLATEKLRKPEVCISLWDRVLEFDPENPDALASLAKLYERARDWEPLARVLEKLTDQLSPGDDLKQQLQKLGMIYADKAGDNEGAVRAFRRLLELDPTDRRAQEQLKRRYVALKAWDELEDFYATTEKWDELIRVFEREADSDAAAQEDRIALLFRAARLWLERKDKPDRAARAYEKVLGIDADNLAAAEALSPIYEGVNDSRKLVTVYEVRLRHLSAPEDRFALLRQTGGIYEERLRDPEHAFEKYLEAFAAEPTQDAVREDLGRLAEKMEGGWERVLEAYRAVIDNTAGEEVVALRLSFAEVLRGAGQLDDAIAQYQQVYELSPERTEAIASLGELYRQTQRYRDLLDVYERRQEFETDPNVRQELAYAVAALWENELEDPDRAIEAYRNILDEYGEGDVEAYRALDRLYEVRERWDDLAATLQRRVDLGPETDEELASLKFRLGRVTEQHLGDKRAAVELYSEVLMLMAEHDGAREALESLLQDEAVAAPCARILEPVYEAQGQWEKLVRALEVLAAHTEEREEQLALFTKIGETAAARLGDAERSFDAFGRAFQAVPSDETNLQRLELLAAEQERVGQLVELLKDRAAAHIEPGLSRSLWLKAAALSEGQLGDIEGAVAAYRHVVDDNPDDIEALDALEQVFRRTERWRDLLPVLRRKVELVVEPAEKEFVLTQMASIHEAALEEPAEAITLYREVLETDPTSQGALSALDRLFESQGMWSELADNVDRQLALAEEPAEQIHHMLRLAELREARMGAVEAAIETYREVLERAPGNESALAALERLLGAEEYQLVVAEILEPLYRDAAEFEKLIGLYEIQVAKAESVDQRVALLHQIAELCEVALEQPARAFESYARALAFEPSSPRTQESLERLARLTGGAQGLAEVYERQVSAVEDPLLAALLHMKAAQIREADLGDVESAIGHYRRVLELDDQHLEAAGSLERLFEGLERHEELAGALLVKARMLPAAEEQKAYLFRAARIYEELLERLPDAVRVYHEVLDVDPEDERALEKLIELYLRLENWEQLLEIYSRKVDIVFDPEEKKRLYIEMGAVYEREVNDVDRAIDTYQRILEIDPDDMMAIGRLDVLYQAAENWEELQAVLEREAEIATDPFEVISYRFRIAELWHFRLEDAPRAIEMYRDILEIVPEHEPTLHALGQLVGSDDYAVPAAVVLEQVYRQSAQWPSLIRMLEVQIARDSDPLRQVELLHQVAELCELQLGDVRQAFDAFARALPLDHRNPDTLAGLERLAEQLNGWSQLTGLYDTLIERLRSTAPDEMVEPGMRAATIYESQLGDVDAAISRYRVVLEADPGHVPAIEALSRLYEASQRWPELAEILRSEMEISSSPDEMLDKQFRLGNVLKDCLNDVDGAIVQFKEILAAAPEHSGALSALEMLFAERVQPLAIGEILEPLYRMQESWERWINLQEVLLQFQGDLEARVALMLRIAEVAEERLGDHAGAFTWLQRAVLEDASHDHVVSEVERLAQMLSGWEQLADTYVSVVETVAEPALQAAIAKRLARVYEEEIGDVERAEQTLRYAIASDSSDVESLAALDRIYEQHAAFEALVDVLRKQVALADHPSDAVELRFRLGQLLENDLGRIDDAVAVYNEVLGEVDAEHHDAIKALKGIYTRQQDWPNLYATLEREQQVVSGDSAQSDVLAQMAFLAAQHLNKHDKAIELWQRVLDLRGEDPAALNSLGNIYAARENWRDLVDILEREVAVVDEDALRIQIYADLGRIWYEKLERDRNALENWERILDIDPANAGALFEIARIHRDGAQHQDLVDTLNRVLEVGATSLDPAALEGTYLELGRLYASKLQQPMDAVEAYTKALEIQPGNFSALDALQAIHEEEGQWEDAIGVRERRVLAQQEPEEKIAGLLAIAEVWAERVEQPDQGASAFERVLEIAPLHELAFEKLEELNRAAGRWDALIESFLARVEATEEPARRVALLRTVAQVYEQELEDKEQAFEALQFAWTEDFGDRETTLELARVAADAQKWNELLSAANEALQQTEDPQTRIAICLACAHWYGQELGRPDYAIPYYEQILALDPSSVPAMRQMAELYRATQQWKTLAQVLARLVEMTPDGSEKADAYVQMGALCQEQLGVPAQAGSYFQKALEVDPVNVGALRALERIYSASGQWAELLEIQRRKVDALEDPDEVRAAQLEVAQTYEERLNNTEAAIASYQQVVEGDAHNLPALRGLERLYERTERWPELAEVLEREFEVVTSENDQIEVLSRLAGMFEREFRKPERAAERLEQVLSIDPLHLPALDSLANIYRTLQRWEDLVQTYERHVNATPERDDKIRLFRAIGGVYAVELQDPARAIDAYLNVLSLREDEPETLDALARLYEKQGEYASALDMMEQLAAQTSEPEAIVGLRFRMGRVLDEHLGDRVGAVGCYEQAIDLDPSHLESLEALGAVYVDGGEWGKAAKLLVQEIEHQSNSRQVAKLLARLGSIYDEHLDEHAKGIESFEKAYETDPDNLDAALPLVDEYMTQEAFDRALPLLQALVRQGGGREAHEQHRLAFLLGECAQKLGQVDEAIRAFSRAHELDSTHLPSLSGLAGAHYANEEWDNAFKYYQMILVHHRDALGSMETADTFYRLGKVKNAQGERRKALNMFDKALEEDPVHRPTMEAMVDVHRGQANWEQVIEFKNQILEIADEEERLALMEEVGDLWQQKLKNLDKAIELYAEASTVDPNNHQVLHKLLLTYQSTKQWDNAIEIIERVADLDERTEAKSKYAYTIGVIHRDELKDEETAIEAFNRALDLDVEQLKAFEAINKILTTRKDWKHLERAFRKMLHRVVGQGKTDLEFNLWHNLGIIYRDRQKQYENAAEAFQMASRIKPEVTQEHKILAELFTQIPSRIKDAIAEHQWLLREDPYRVESYQELYRLYFGAREYDKAWCLSATLAFLKKADAEQQQFFEQYKSQGMIRPQSRIDNERWVKDLFHPDEDVYVGKIFETLAPAVHQLKASADKALHLHKKYEVDPGESTVTFARTFGFVAQVLNLQIVPRLFLRSDTQGGLMHVAGSNPPATVCGATLLSGFSPQDLAFVLGRHLAFYRPEHFIRTLLGATGELRALLLAGMRIGGVDLADPGVQQTAEQLLSKLQPVQVEALRKICKRFVEAGARTDIKRWTQMVELTGVRAGFVMCNDLDTAARMVQALPPEGPMDVPPKEKVKEIVLFSVSESYFRIREALGIQISV